MVTGVKIWGEGRFVFSTQNPSGFRTHATKHQTIGINKMPSALDFACFR
jgi:hypothetical protein